MARCSLKNVLVGAHQLKKLKSSASVASEFQTVSWNIQVIIWWISGWREINKLPYTFLLLLLIYFLI
jgi:hypothetical protein